MFFRKETEPARNQPVPSLDLFYQLEDRLAKAESKLRQLDIDVNEMQGKVLVMLRRTNQRLANLDRKDDGLKREDLRKEDPWEQYYGPEPRQETGYPFPEAPRP